MKCRTCGSANVHRSRLRNARERIVTMLTNRRYYRCHDCNDRMTLRRPPEPKPVVRASSNKRRMRLLVKWAKVIAVILVLLAGLYIVASPYFELRRPTPRQQR